MTIKEYLNSRKFKKEYKCWHYAYKIYGEDGKCLFDDDSFPWYDDDWAEKFLAQHDVEFVEMGWELGDDHEMYAFAKIWTSLTPGFMRVMPCNTVQKED